MKIKRHRSTVNAFTLIEMLTVIAIIAILSAILIPAISASRERSHIAYCANNLGQIGKALMEYVNDNKDRLPPVSRTGAGSAWDIDLLPYLGGVSNVFACPSDPYRTGSKSNRTYSANGGNSTNRTPFGGYSTNPPPLRFGDLDYNKSDIILIGERPGVSTGNRGNIGAYAFCGMDQIAGTVHNHQRGGNYLMGSMAVLYLETNKVANSALWTLH